MTFDYSKPIIHILNKQKFIYDMQRDAQYRKNVMVMGDILDDVKMCKESQHEVVLKVGYLNDVHRNGHLLDEFARTFDIVITGDGTLQPINYMLNKVFARDLQMDDEAFHRIRRVLA